MEMNELCASADICIGTLSRNINDSFGASIITDVCEPICEILNALVGAEEMFAVEEAAIYQRISEAQAMG